MLAKSSKIKPESLPPSERAAYFHSLRVYLQVQEWNYSAVLRPDEWGWKMKNGAYIPIMTDAPPASDDILNVTKCSVPKWVFILKTRSLIVTFLKKLGLLSLY